VDIAEQVAEARRRAAEVSKRLEEQRRARENPQQASAQNGDSKEASMGLSIAERIAAAKAKMAQLQSTPSTAAFQPPPPPPPPRPSYQAPVRNDSARMDFTTGVRGGMSAPIHPLLSGLGDSQDKKETKGFKGKKTAEAAQPAEKVNPYLSEEKAPSGRSRRTLEFTHNLHSRPAMVAANEMRRKANLEALKLKLAIASTKVGLDDSAEQEAFMVPMPPDVEFWDEFDLDSLNLYVLHPILIEPPQDKLLDKKPMKLMLTQKEQKKMRRIKRMEIHKEEQAKIRLGLVPTPAPKIKHSNVMRVYGEMAVQDPTAVEAMVNKQVADRKNTHLQTNASRQLTKEEKLEKVKLKASEDAAKGLSLSVFKISLPSSSLLGKHRYLIDKNAKDCHDLTGFAMITPNFTLVLIIAGEHSTRFYKKLMCHRIKWKAIVEGGGVVPEPEAWAGVEDDTCVLLHQGQIRDRKFKRWGGLREVETEQDAKKALAGAKLENFWIQAKALEKAKEKPIA
jgi:U4/U6 small nuclear ribonucleoprotein PRP3